jgi:hypothetical protein
VARRKAVERDAPVLSYEDVESAVHLVFEEMATRPRTTVQGALLRTLEVLRVRFEIKREAKR